MRPLLDIQHDFLDLANVVAVCTDHTVAIQAARGHDIWCGAGRRGRPFSDGRYSATAHIRRVHHALLRNTAATFAPVRNRQQCAWRKRRENMSFPSAASCVLRPTTGFTAGSNLEGWGSCPG